MGNVTTTQVLFLGLDNSGKTTIINVCSNDFKPPADLDQIKPTTGHSVTHFNSKENKKLQFGAWDLPGREQFRSLWKNYYKHAGAIVFVVDSAEDEERMDDCKEVLNSVLQDLELREVPLLICANKQDLPNAKGANVITEQLGLNNANTAGLNKRSYRIIATCAKTGDGLKFGFDWLANEIALREKKKKAAQKNK